MVRSICSLAVLAGVVLSGPALADPCGMVPPIYVTDNTSLVRVGDQQTYVFYKDGIETFVIRPGFKGQVEDFGMLISFPTPPALRKVSEDIFPQIAKAIDPPEVVIDVRWQLLARNAAAFGPPAPVATAALGGLELQKDQVRVLARRGRGHVSGRRARGRQRRRAEALDGR